MMNLDDIAIDPDKLEQGDWVGDIPGMGTLRLKVRGINNADYRALQNRLLDAVPRAKRIRGQIDQKELARIATECLIETVLLDWEGLGINGEPAPYSKAKARELLTNPRWVRFRDAVAWAAGVVGDDVAADQETDKGN